jgi:hypothetical protein
VVPVCVVTKDVVDVELVVVELSPVKFWRVDEPLTRRLVKVPRVPVKALAVSDPMVPLFAKKLVVDAVVAKKVDEVALVTLTVVPKILVEKKFVVVA